MILEHALTFLLSPFLLSRLPENAKSCTFVQKWSVQDYININPFNYCVMR